MLGLTCNFVGLWGFLLLTASCGISMGLLVSSLARTEVTAISLVPLLLFPQLLLGGFIRLYGALEEKAWLQHLADIMPIRWSFEGLVVMEYESVLLSRKALQQLGGEDAPSGDLKQLSDVIGFSALSIQNALVALFASLALFSLMTWLVLSRKKS